MKQDIGVVDEQNGGVPVGAAEQLTIRRRVTGGCKHHPHAGDHERSLELGESGGDPGAVATVGVPVDQQHFGLEKPAQRVFIPVEIAPDHRVHTRSDLDRRGGFERDARPAIGGRHAVEQACLAELLRGRDDIGKNDLRLGSVFRAQHDRDFVQRRVAVDTLPDRHG